MALRARVLLVEDHPQLREVLSRYLQGRGCEVETAAHGAQGLEQVRRNHFDAVVSDINMPLMDGLTLRRHVLIRDPSLRHRYILCSSAPLPPNVDQDIHFLLKPFSGRELWELLERLLPSKPDAPITNEH